MGAHWAARGAVGSGRCHRAGTWSAARGGGTGPGLGQGHRGPACSPRSRPCVPGAAVRRPRGGSRPGPAPLPPRPGPPRSGAAPCPLAAGGAGARPLSARRAGRRAERGPRCLVPAGLWGRRGAVAMGVPKFYRWISERYPCLSQVLKEHQVSWERSGAAWHRPAPGGSWPSPRWDEGEGRAAGPRPRPALRDRVPARAGSPTAGAAQGGGCGSAAGSGGTALGDRWGAGEAFGAPWQPVCPGRDPAGGQQCPEPAAGGRRCLRQSRTRSAPFPRGMAGPRLVPARGCPAGLSPLALGPLGSSAVLPQHSRGARGRSLLLVGLRKVTAADGQWRGNDEGQVLQLCCVSLLLPASDSLCSQLNREVCSSLGNESCKSDFLTVGPRRHLFRDITFGTCWIQALLIIIFSWCHRCGFIDWIRMFWDRW